MDFYFAVLVVDFVLVAVFVVFGFSSFPSLSFLLDLAGKFLTLTAMI